MKLLLLLWNQSGILGRNNIYVIKLFKKNEINVIFKLHTPLYMKKNTRFCKKIKTSVWKLENKQTLTDEKIDFINNERQEKNVKKKK